MRTKKCSTPCNQKNKKNIEEARKKPILNDKLPDFAKITSDLFIFSVTECKCDFCGFCLLMYGALSYICYTFFATFF